MSTFDPDKYLAEQDIPWSDVPKNAVEDIKGIAHGMADQGKRALDPVGIGEAISKGSFDPIKEAALEPLHQVKSLGQQILNTATHPIETFKKQPVSTGLLVAPLLGLGGERAPLPKEAPPIFEDFSGIPPKPSVSGVAPSTFEEAIGPKSPPPPIPETAAPPPQPDFIQGIKGKIPREIVDPIQQVNNYLKNQYGEAAKKPGMANVASDYLKEHSQNMNLKEMGAAPGQVRKIGTDRAHALADYAEENDLVGPKIGTQGRERLVKQRLEDAGGAVGAFRKIATDRGAVQDIPSLTKQIQAKLDQKYVTRGMYSGQKGSYLKALDELKKTDGSASALSDKVTEMFKEAKNQNPLGKPTGPFADVAREVRTINHDAISKVLSPQEMTLYEKSLEDFGALTQIREFVKRRSSTEAGGRLGPGSGISRAAVQKFLDSFGYRTEAKIASKLADFIRKNPDIMSRPKDIFRQYIDEAAEAVHEMGDVAH